LRKICSYLLLMILCLTFYTCAINKLNDEKTVITLRKNAAGNPVTIALTKGPQWAHKITPGPFVIHVYPQLVFWVENTAGELRETIYISDADGKYGKHAAKQKMDAEFFRLCFPLWASKVIQADKQLPSAEAPYPDAITSATPQSSFELRTKIRKMTDTFTLYAELNKSGDYNEIYTEAKTDWIGQPSLVYAVEIDHIDKGKEYHLKPYGHTAIQLNEPILVKDFTGIDTALDMVSDIKVVFE